MNSLLMIIFMSGFAPALERIDEVKLNRKKPFTLFMHPGRSTTVDLPCSISYAVPGSHGDVKTEIGPDKDNSLLIWLSNEASNATNLTVRCGEKVIVFDIIPSRSNHQDYLNITSFENAHNEKHLVATSASKTEEKEAFRNKKLLKTSEDKRD